MSQRASWRTAAPIVGLGLVVLAVAVAHVVVNDDPAVPELLDASIIVVFATVILIVGYTVYDDALDRRSARRILAFAVGTSAVVGGLAGVFVFSRALAGDDLTTPTFVLAIGFTLGAAAGTLIGYYLDHYETSLEQETELRRRLTILQRVIRHNIRTEVGIVEGVSVDLAERVDDPDVEAGLQTVKTHIDRVHRLAEKSQDLAAVWQTRETVVVDVPTALDGAIATVTAEHPTFSVDHEILETLVVDAHPRLEWAFEEALDNAARHTEDATVTVSATATDDGVLVRFVDSGGGIPRAEVAPLRRGHERPVEHTTGIGLWLMYWIVEYSNGELDVRPGESGGTVVEMRLANAEATS